MVEEFAWRRDALTALRRRRCRRFAMFSRTIAAAGLRCRYRPLHNHVYGSEGGDGVVRKDPRPQAYHLVRQHFAVLGKALRENNGAIVKTVGDAIMASFSNPFDGLNCGTQIHRGFETFNANFGWTPVTIRSVFVGRCISVMPNNDYLRRWGAMSFSLKNLRKTRLLHRWRVSLRQNVNWPRLEGFGIRFPIIALPKRRWCRGGPRKHLTVRHSWCSLLTWRSKLNRTKQEQKRMQHC